jgi:hypothetical protein
LNNVPHVSQIYKFCGLLEVKATFVNLKSVDHNFNGSNEQTGGYEPNMYIVDTSGVLLIENNCNETIKLTNVALTSSSPQNLYICETCGTLFKQKWQLNKHTLLPLKLWSTDLPWYF